MQKSNIVLLVLGICLFGSACKKEVTSLHNPPAQGSSDTTTIVTPAPPVVETLPAIQTPVNYRVDANIGGYLEALPNGYAHSGNQKYPLLIFLHGLGQLGNGTTDLYKVAAGGVPALLANKKFPPDFVVNNQHYSFIVLSPQFKAWPQPNDINDMLNYALSKYRIDTTRMYLSGLSMGGGGTWDYAIAYGQRLAAIVPIAGASYPTPQKGQQIAKDSLAVWAFQNADDPTVPAFYSQDYVKYINQYHPKYTAQLTLWPTGGHDAWTKATNPNYRENGKNMYEWMLSYSKK